MIKKIAGIITAVVAVLVAFSLLTMLFMPKYIQTNTDGRLTAEYYREKTNIDVITVGASTVQAAISPMVLYRDYGITAYNRSNSSQVMALSYYMVEDAIRCNKPELVICDVGFIYEPEDYVDEGSSRKSLDTMKWSKSKSDAIKAMMDPSESYMDYVFPILRFHSRWNDLNAEDLKYWVYKPTVTSNGQILQFKKGAADKDFNPYQLEEGSMACDKNMDYLQKMADLCKDKGVQLILIKLPWVEGNWCKSIDAQICDFAAENNLVYRNFIDEYETLGFAQTEDFTDGQHMNSYGAEKFSKVLGAYIKDNYTITDRSKDKKCIAVFNKKLEKYNYAFDNQIPTEKYEANALTENDNTDNN